MSDGDGIAIGVAGALGRMGLALAAAAQDRPGLRLAARFDRPGASAEGLVSLDDALGACAVIVDFTTPDASVALAERCAGRGGPALVIGSTGLSPDQSRRIAQAASRIAIVQSGNFSLGVNLLLSLVARAARLLPAADWDIEVSEAHHRRKIDAPSGTALMLGQAAAKARRVELDAVAVRARDGVTGARRGGDIGFSVVRGGGVVGEHAVAFLADDEIITLSHSARDRSLFARGALHAAAWAAHRPPGLYDMQDVLGPE